MARPELSYKPIIIAIHGRRRVPFAIHEIAHETGFSRAAVSRIFDRLKLMGFLQKNTRGFNSRVWMARKTWPVKSCHSVITTYELWQLAAGDHSVDLTPDEEEA